MTLRQDIDFDNTNYVPVLDHGFVGLVDSMGDDSAIVQAARVSYGAGTKQVQDDRNLIRYLMRHEHTTPFEMCELKFHIKLPIFVMRQLVRHRTASINEYSARYSILTDEFYIPELEQLQKQSTTNKQGREESDWDTAKKQKLQQRFEVFFETNYSDYEQLLNEGMARELARSVLPVSGYTELYWKANLKNFLHMARLRMDRHAQWEIQEYARAMYDLAKPLFPEACSAFEDYAVNSVKFSAKEFDLLKQLLNSSRFEGIVAAHGDEKSLAREFNLGQRELAEFKTKLGIL
jgi:thymidylate synthase (FAD)